MRQMTKLICGAALPVLVAAFLIAAVSPKAYADEWNKETKMTFSQAVQVPGRVLPPGTYVFRLLDSQSDRHIVQIFNETGQRLITTVLAIPDYRLTPRGHTVISFDERLTGTPEAIKEWFYPGDLYGQEFVYRPGEELAAQTAATQTTEVAMAAPIETPAPTEATPEPTPEPAPAPPVTEEQPAQPEQAAPAPEPAPAPVENNNEPATLPKTGSEFPLILMLGSSGLGLGTLLHALRRRYL